MTCAKIWLGIGVACVAAASALPAPAVDALSFPTGGGGSGVAGFMEGGTGWSFVPTTNLLVTSAGYLDLATAGGDPAAVVTFWSGTNTAIASFSGIVNPAAGLGELVLASIPALPLAAGQLYSITVHIPPLASTEWYGALYDNLGVVQYNPFQVAAELGQYEALVLEPDGTFAPFTADPEWNQQLLWLGPTFTYEIGSPRPALAIAQTNSDSIVLTWPTNAVGFVLQSSHVVTGSYTNVNIFPSVAGTNYTTTLPRTNKAGFFRLVKSS